MKNKSQQFLENLNENGLTQFTGNGRVFRTAGSTVATLESAIYKISADMRGIFFEKVEITTDALIKINNKKYNELLEEIDKFWAAEGKFKSLGFTDKRAFILHSVPGVGKSCLLKQVMNKSVAENRVVFLSDNLHLLSEALHEFREVEPERKCIVVIEELDEVLYSGSKSLSDLLDGPTSVGGVFYFGTTNYIDRIPPRMKRPSRFDRVEEVLPPDEADRLEYLKAKLGMNEDEAKLQEYAKATEGFTFAHLKEFLVSVCCLGNDVGETVARLRNMTCESKEKFSTTFTYGSLEEAEFCKKFAEMKPAKKNQAGALNENRATRLMKGL